MSFSSASGTEERAIAISPTPPTPAGSTFAPTARLLPKPLRGQLLQLYWALRTLDDLVDDRRPEADGRISAVESWCETGIATTPETRVFHALEHLGMSRDPVAEFCKAMRHDMSNSQIGSDDELERYCEQVSGSAGVMIAQLTGARSVEAEAGMRSLGKAVQLTHILRDIDVDADEGRQYIPTDAVLKFGSIEPQSREELVNHFCNLAFEWFDSSMPVLRLLPEGRRWVAASAGLYRETLVQIAGQADGEIHQRARVPARRKWLVLSRAVLFSK